MVPPGETLELWRVRVTNERPTPARLSLFGAVEFCLWDANDDATNFQRNYSIGEVELHDGVIYHRTEYRERRDHVAFFASSEPAAGFDTAREAFLGPYRGWDRPLAVERGATSGSVAHGWQPIGALQVALELPPGASREVTFTLGYAENPRDAKFDAGRPHRHVPDRAGHRPPAGAGCRGSRRRGGARDLGRAPRRAPGRHRQRARGPHGERLEPVPVRGDVQPLALGVAVRVRDRPRDGLPGLDAGPPGVRAPPARPGPRAPARHRRDPAARRRGVPPVPAAHPAWQRRRRVGVQRRPAVAGARGRRLPQGDGRPGGPRRAGPVRQRPRQRGAAGRASPALRGVHAGAPGAPRPAADRAGGLERLPQPEHLLERARRVVPDTLRTAPAASPSPCSSPACS